MRFTFLTRPGGYRETDGPTFRLDRIWRRNTNGEVEMSHLLDRSYDYQSMRELRWHLAERFGVPVTTLQLDPVTA
ncbi:hypothetical protein [Amorphus sp. 3PC139-8]|uniref:hypothetical protein n=1 Tax=Amorphus sp. 3PC139-8 TaxID=2735676 RepID=UPI00345C774A